MERLLLPFKKFVETQYFLSIRVRNFIGFRSTPGFYLQSNLSSSDISNNSFRRHLNKVLKMNLIYVKLNNCKR